MAFTQAKVDSLKAVAGELRTYVEGFNNQVSAFEDSLKVDLEGTAYHHVLSKGEADVDGYCLYSEMAWHFFRGPLPKGYEAGWHLTIRGFKAKDEDYGNESKYLEAWAEKLLLSSIENKESAIPQFDAFLDSFKIAIDSRLNK